MKQYALLFKSPSNLEIYVTDHGHDEDGCFIGDVPFNNSRQTVLGVICFESEENHIDILRKFGEKYLGHGRLSHRTQENLWSTLSYPLSFESFITQAFLDYFSNLE